MERKKQKGKDKKDMEIKKRTKNSKKFKHSYKARIKEWKLYAVKAETEKEKNNSGGNIWNLKGYFKTLKIR